MMINFRHDPFQIFRYSKSPVGLYARQKWLADAGSQQWKTDFEETVSALIADQLPDGSWNHDIGSTIRHLFGLHLTLRESNPKIDSALGFLLKKIHLGEEHVYADAEPLSSGFDGSGLPFTAGRADMLLIGATLFLATIFGRHSQPAVRSAYSWLSAVGVQGNGRWFDTASSHNVFRAMVVHPVFAGDKATALVVERLAEAQTDNGDWGDERPFYQTVNALAHLNLSGVDDQIDCAFKRIYKIQKSDGTWGRVDSEWNTFLVVHALKNRKLL